MIYDTDKNLKNYAALNPAFEAIAKFVEGNDMKTLECGGYDVAEGIKVGISEYSPENNPSSSSRASAIREAGT